MDRTMELKATLEKYLKEADDAPDGLEAVVQNYGVEDTVQQMEIMLTHYADRIEALWKELSELKTKHQHDDEAEAIRVTDWEFDP